MKDAANHVRDVNEALDADDKKVKVELHLHPSKGEPIIRVMNYEDVGDKGILLFDGRYYTYSRYRGTSSSTMEVHYHEASPPYEIH